MVMRLGQSEANNGNCKYPKKYLQKPEAMTGARTTYANAKCLTYITNVLALWLPIYV